MTNSESSFATMQADIDKAIQLKQQATTETSTDKADDRLSESVKTLEHADLDEVQLSRMIEMAWEDRTPFGAIEHSYGLNESAVIKLMRQELKPSSFRLWRTRVTNRATKHEAKRTFEVGRAYCKTQYKPR